MKRVPTYQQLLRRVRKLEKESLEHNQVEESLRLTWEFTSTVMNSLSAHIAILNGNGIILETNRAWGNFARANQIRILPDCVGVNYLKICDSAQGDSSEGARDAAAGIRAVIGGEVREFVLDYPCHSPDVKRWFYMRATPLTGPGSSRAVVSHENITPLKLAEEALRMREIELEQQKQHLEEANIALKVLLERREKDKRELENKVLSNTKELIEPCMTMLKKTSLDSQQKAYLDILESHLNEIISLFLHQLSYKNLNLTPQQIRVAGLVKDGKTTKEIAEILNISSYSVDFHRKSIREKLGLKNKGVNLRSYLLSLSS